MGWQNTSNYKFNNPQLLEHLRQNGNYGVLCGINGLTVIDADSKSVLEAVENDLPETLTIETGRGGKHFYYICTDLEKAVRLRDPNGGPLGHLGDIQNKGKQVVGPGSIHPNGKSYRIVKEINIETITSSQIRQALREFLDTNEVEMAAEEEKRQAKEAKIKLDNLKITDVMNITRLTRKGDGYIGAHPIHGSQTGSNFHITPSKNVWYCFRHSSGGGGLSVGLL